MIFNEVKWIIEGEKELVGQKISDGIEGTRVEETKKNLWVKKLLVVTLIGSARYLEIFIFF